MLCARAQWEMWIASFSGVCRNLKPFGRDGDARVHRKHATVSRVLYLHRLWDHNGCHKGVPMRAVLPIWAMVHGLWGTPQSMAPVLFGGCGGCGGLDAHFVRYEQDRQASHAKLFAKVKWMVWWLAGWLHAALWHLSKCHWVAVTKKHRASPHAR